jgi:hypothetical protein
MIIDIDKPIDYGWVAIVLAQPQTIRDERDLWTIGTILFR